jgi:enoyl-CoA hydratase
MPVDMERRGAVAVLTLNRPERLNTLSPDMLEDLEARADEVSADEEVRAVVITGAGEKAFSAGADISVVRDAAPLDARRFAGLGHRVLDRVAALRMPVIAAVNGYALGGGCELALACDLRVASSRARLGLPEVTLGIFPGWGGTQRLPLMTTPAFAKDMIFTGRHVPAEEALAAGLVNRVHPPEELLEAAVGLAEEIAGRAGWAVAAAKAMVDAALGDDLRSHLARELDLFALAFATEDQKEGMAAFLEKREARFRGR